MKQIYKPKTPYGYDGPWEVADEFPTAFPFTEITIPEGILAPSFDWNTHLWQEATPPETMAFIEKMQVDVAKLGQSTVTLALTDMKQQKEIDSLKPEEGGEADV